MLDGVARRLIDPTLSRCGGALARRGVSGDQLTLLGFGIGLLAAFAIAIEADAAALALVLASRLLDGLDGAVARAATESATGTDRGGYLDIVLDFAFYGAIPLAFAIRDPEANALAAATLLFAFYVNGASFLAFAAVAQKRGIERLDRGPKAIPFTAGLAEATETIIVFVAWLLAPAWFAPLAYGFAALTLASAGARVGLAWRVFAGPAGAGKDEAPIVPPERGR